jgi:hypothetical protein
MHTKIKKPSSVLIENIAANLAAEFYEAALRTPGLKPSKHKTHKAFVKANIEKFLPKAVDLCLDMLGNPYTPADQKQMIFEALQDRVNDPENDHVMLPELDVKTLLPKQEPKPVIVNTTVGRLDINDMKLPIKGV